jgi:prepilin-type N-terminal cleavage/methylation domain-containing protein/prepilin-type processing-associated H-X9-DG protein
MKFNPTPDRAFTLIELLTVIAIIGILAGILIPTVGAVRGQTNTTRCASNLRQVGQAAILYASENKNFLPVNVTSGRQPGWISDRWANLLKPYLTSASSGFRDAVFYCSKTDPASYAIGGDGAGQFAVSDRLNGNAWPGAPVTVAGIVYNYSGQTFPRGVPMTSIGNPSRTVMAGETSFVFQAGKGGPNLAVDNFFPAANRGAAANHRSDGDPTKGDGKSNYLYADGHIATLSLWPGRGAFEVQ